MESMSTAGFEIFFEAEERETAEMVAEAVQKSSQLLTSRWAVPPPPRCPIYVMSSLADFIYASAPSWGWRMLWKLSRPLWHPRYLQKWRVAGGWVMPYKAYPVVGIKPYRLIKNADKRYGEIIFVEETDPAKKVQQITCHELTHAFTTHLGLPMWMHEGLAMRAVDLVMEQETVRGDTLELLRQPPEGAGDDPQGYRELDWNDPVVVAYQVARGYWLTRHLDESWPELLRELLSRPLAAPELEARVAEALGLEQESFWTLIGERLADHIRPGSHGADPGAGSGPGPRGQQAGGEEETGFG